MLHHAENPSGLLAKFRVGRLLPLLLLVLAGCSDPENDPVCDNYDHPAVLELVDVLPAAGSTVENEDIVHAFTVVASTGTFEGFTFAYAEGHEAGEPTPSPLKFAAETDAETGDVTYTFEPVTWTGTGRVALNETGQYADSTRCFILPFPLFSYEVEP